MKEKYYVRNKYLANTLSFIGYSYDFKDDKYLFDKSERFFDDLDKILEMKNKFNSRNKIAFNK